MSRSKKGAKGPGAELWSKRPLSGAPTGRTFKKISMKIERAQARAALHKEKKKLDEDE